MCSSDEHSPDPRPGWVHEQQNTKLVIDRETVTPIINEHGNNTYEQVDDAECAEAAEWWTKRQATWDQIQSAWIDVRAQHQTYSVDTMGGVFPLWMRLFWLAKTLPAKEHARLYNATRKLLSKKLGQRTTECRIRLSIIRAGACRSSEAGKPEESRVSKPTAIQCSIKTPHQSRHGAHNIKLRALSAGMICTTKRSA